MAQANKAEDIPASGEKGELIATAAVLARWLGISGKSVYDLAKAGVLVRSSRDQFLLEESVRRYCEHIRGTAPHERPNPADTRGTNVNGAG
jgi:hypothetical protein